MDKTIVLHPIGIIHSPYTEAKGTPIQGVLGDKTEAWVELADRYVDGLKTWKGSAMRSSCTTFISPTERRSSGNRTLRTRSTVSLP